MKDSALAASILSELSRRGQTLASAESLTGGMVGALLTDIPGASANYLGGVISYATRLKATLARPGRCTSRSFRCMAIARRSGDRRPQLRWNCWRTLLGCRPLGETDDSSRRLSVGRTGVVGEGG